MSIKLVSANDDTHIPTIGKATNFANVEMLGTAPGASDNAADCTPREALMRALVLIDRGEINPDTLIIAYANTEDGMVSTGMVSASPSTFASVGLLETVKPLFLV